MRKMNMKRLMKSFCVIMYDLWNEMLAKGASTEEIARAVSAKRNEIRLANILIIRRDWLRSKRAI